MREQRGELVTGLVIDRNDDVHHLEGAKEFKYTNGHIKSCKKKNSKKQSPTQQHKWYQYIKKYKSTSV